MAMRVAYIISLERWPASNILCPQTHFLSQVSKVGSQEMPAVTEKFSLRIQNEVEQRLTEFPQENALAIAITLLQQHKRRLYTWTSPEGQY